MGEGGRRRVANGEEGGGTEKERGGTRREKREKREKERWREVEG